MPSKKTDNSKFCSFCGKNQSQVNRLIASPMMDAYICEPGLGMHSGALGALLLAREACRSAR